MGPKGSATTRREKTAMKGTGAIKPAELKECYAHSTHTDRYGHDADGLYPVYLTATRSRPIGVPRLRLNTKNLNGSRIRRGI
jgi:hypothetical protein